MNIYIHADLCVSKNMNKNIISRIIINSPKLENTQMSINNKMDE